MIDTTIILIFIILVLVLLLVDLLLGVFRNSKRLNYKEYESILDLVQLFNFSSISNLPIVQYDEVVENISCDRNPVPASFDTDCVSICGQYGKNIYFGENQGFNGSGIALSPGYYCVNTIQPDLDLCSRIYGRFVVSADGYVCENLFKTGMTGFNANLPLYKFVNGRYISEIVLRRRSDDVEVDPNETFVNFNDPNIINEYYVDASNATYDGYNIVCKNFSCFQDPCALVPYTDFRYNLETGLCNCVGGTNSDPTDLSSTCIGTGQVEDSWDPTNEIFTFKTNCVGSVDVDQPFSNAYPCRDQASIINTGSIQLYASTSGWNTELAKQTNFKTIFQQA